MADQYRPSQVEARELSNEHYGEGILFFILPFSKQWLKPFQVIISTLMAYDFIYHIPQRVRLSILEQCFYIFFLLDSVPPQVCSPFNGRLLPLTYEYSGGNGQNCMSSIILSC